MTTEQLTLLPLTTPDHAPGTTIQQRWEAWEAANPWVVPYLERLIRDLLDAGHKRVGLKQVWEVLRYDYARTTGDGFKANNNYTSRAARRVLERNPGWSDVISTRELRAA